MTVEELRTFLRQHQLLDLPPAYRTVTMENDGRQEQVSVAIQGLDPFVVLFEREHDWQETVLPPEMYLTRHLPFDTADDSDFQYLGLLSNWRTDEKTSHRIYGAPETDRVHETNLSFTMTFCEDESVHLTTGLIRKNKYVASTDHHINRIAWAQAMNDILFVAEHQTQTMNAADIYRLLTEREQQRHQQFIRPKATGDKDLQQQLWQPRS